MFGQLRVFPRNAAPLAHHFEDIVRHGRAHETLVPISGSVFPAGEFFNRIGRSCPLVMHEARLCKGHFLRRAAVDANRSEWLQTAFVSNFCANGIDHNGLTSGIRRKRSGGGYGQVLRIGATIPIFSSISCKQLGVQCFRQSKIYVWAHRNVSGFNDRDT